MCMYMYMRQIKHYCVLAYMYNVAFAPINQVIDILSANQLWTKCIHVYFTFHSAFMETSAKAKINVSEVMLLLLASVIGIFVLVSYNNNVPYSRKSFRWELLRMSENTEFLQKSFHRLSYYHTRNLRKAAIHTTKFANISGYTVVVYRHILQRPRISIILL